MSDEYLRRIIDDQKKQIEKLKSYKSYLDGQRKLELHPNQEGRVCQLVKIELKKHIKLICDICVLHKYASDRTICKIIIDRLNIDNNFRETFWECY